MKASRNKLVLAAFVLQILMLLFVIALVYVVSARGRTVVLEMTGYDPYDALRGRYLMLDNPADEVMLEPGSMERYEDKHGTNIPVYVILDKDPDSGLSSFSYASLNRPGNGIPYIKCMSRYQWTQDGNSWVTVCPRINQYYLNEKHAARLDRAVRWDTPIRLSLKIWRGLYVVDGIEIDGQNY